MRKSLVLAAGLAAAYARCAAAADLEEVTIVGQRLEETLPQQLAQYGTKVDTITVQQVQNGGYIDIAGAIRSLAPGMYIAPLSGPFDYVRISLQGSRTQDVLWLVDGVRINNRLYGSTPPLDTLPSNIVERIEVLDGGQALFYGTQSSAGAVNIVTKAFTNAPDGAFSLGGDSNSGRHLDAYYRDSIGRHQFVVYGSSDQSEGFKPFRDRDYQPSSTDRDRSYNMFTAGIKYAYEFSDDLRVDLLYQHSDGKLDFARPAYIATAFNERDEDIVSTKLDYRINDAAELYVKGYGHWWYSHYTEYDNEIGNPGTLDVIDEHDFYGYRDYGINVMTKLALNRGFEYLAGYDFQSYNGNDAVLFIEEKSEHVNALFAQVRTTPDLFATARFAAGLRYNQPSFGQTATVWNASGQVDFTSSLFMRALVGTSFRLPTAEELFANDPNDERGNPNLKPERGRNVNVSVGGKIGGLAEPVAWEVVGYWRDITDLITFDDFDSSTNQSVATNTKDKVTVRGVQVDLLAPFTSDLSASFSYNYNRARMEHSDDQLTRIPKQQLKATLDFHPSAPIGATVTLNHVGTVYDSVWDGREAYGDYTIVDIAGRVYLDSARRSMLNVRLENVFDKEYATSLSTSQRDADGSDYTYWFLGLPRTLTVRYTYKF